MNLDMWRGGRRRPLLEEGGVSLEFTLVHVLVFTDSATNAPAGPHLALVCGLSVGGAVWAPRQLQDTPRHLHLPPSLTSRSEEQGNRASSKRNPHPHCGPGAGSPLEAAVFRAHLVLQSGGS